MVPDAFLCALPSLNMDKVFTFFASLFAAVRSFCSVQRTSDIPVKVFAFDLDVAHTILRLALPLAADSLLLTSAHAAFGAAIPSNAAMRKRSRGGGALVNIESALLNSEDEFSNK